MWVPLIENNEHLSAGADYFVQKHLNGLLSQSKNIDTVLLACTHYPLMQEKIKMFLPEGTKIISQGEIVAKSLVDYLQRHAELEQKCLKEKKIDFFTTDAAKDFDIKGSLFFGSPIQSKHVVLAAQ